VAALLDGVFGGLGELLEVGEGGAPALGFEELHCEVVEGS